MGKLGTHHTHHTLPHYRVQTREEKETPATTEVQWELGPVIPREQTVAFIMKLRLWGRGAGILPWVLRPAVLRAGSRVESIQRFSDTQTHFCMCLTGHRLCMALVLEASSFVL